MQETTTDSFVRLYFTHSLPTTQAGCLLCCVAGFPFLLCPASLCPARTTLRPLKTPICFVRVRYPRSLRSPPLLLPRAQVPAPFLPRPDKARFPEGALFCVVPLRFLLWCPAEPRRLEPHVGIGADFGHATLSTRSEEQKGCKAMNPPGGGSGLLNGPREGARRL